jgi:putative hydrolase of the HAD superfamily
VVAPGRHRPITIDGRVVVFDYGEVISREPSLADRAEIVRIAGAEADPDRFWRVYWEHRVRFDQGTLAPAAYWAAIETDLGLRWDAAQRHALWLADFRSWLAVDPPTLEVLFDLQRGGTRMALLSNAAPEFSSYYRHGMLGDLFEQVFTSSELGVLKPEPAIFRALLDGLGVAPEQVVFIDNLESNVRGAQALGITAHHYTGAAELRAYLERLSEAGVPYPGSQFR